MRVLISGAGVAGPTLAFWLGRQGHEVTVVERATGLRSSGSPIDVRGHAVEVADQMGIMPQLRQAGTDVSAMSFVNGNGRQVGRVNMRAIQRANRSREVELPRGALASILYEVSKDHAEYLFDDTIVTMTRDEHGIDVAFARAASKRFDLVVGSDGLHSTVRRLAFGPEAEFVQHMGAYIATLPLDKPADNGHDVVMHNSPGRMIAIHPVRGKALAAFMFRGPARPDFDHRNTAQHKEMLNAAFANGSWRVPELLEQVNATDGLYFDSVSQVRLPSWSRGRVVLLGDAASCVSLFGDGSTLAMSGAFTLAQALQSGSPEEAFERYEAEHRKQVEPKQRNVNQASALLIPATRTGIHARNLATRLWPLAAAASWAVQLARREGDTVKGSQR